MANRTATKNKSRRTTTVPVTTMEEIPVLSEKERGELITSLHEAEARIKVGEGVEHDSKAFKDRLVRVYRGER
jgi:hypothetical protein